MAVLLTALVAGAGTALGYTNSVNTTNPTAGEVQRWESPVASPARHHFPCLLLRRLRCRPDGSVQRTPPRVAVWLWAVIAAIVVAVFATLAGSRYNILASLNLPRIPVNEGH